MAKHNKDTGTTEPQNSSGTRPAPKAALPARTVRPRAFVRQPNRRYVDVVTNPHGSGTYVVNEQGLELIYRLANDGQPLTTIAEMLGMGGDTFADLRKRQPEAEDAVRRGRSRVVGDMTRVLITKAMRGEDVPLLFALKTLGGFREGVPVEGATPQVAVNIQLVTPAAPGDVVKIIGEIPPPPDDDTGPGGNFR